MNAVTGESSPATLSTGLWSWTGACQKRQNNTGLQLSKARQLDPPVPPCDLLENYNKHVLAAPLRCLSFRAPRVSPSATTLYGSSPLVVIEAEIPWGGFQTHTGDNSVKKRIRITSRENLLSSLVQSYGDRDGFSIFYGLDGDGRSFIRVFGSPIGRIVTDRTGTWYESLTKGKERLSQDPFLAVSSHLASSRYWHAGFLSYELLHSIEEVPRSDEASDIPELLFYEYAEMIEHREGETFAILETIDTEDSPSWRYHEDTLHTAISKPPSHREMPSLSLESLTEELSPFSNFTREHYRSKIEEIKEGIRRGEVYQVNLSQSFNLPFHGDPAEVFLTLTQADPPPRSAFIRYRWREDVISHISASPELYFEVSGATVRCLPIKGTRRRANLIEEDRELKKELLESEKDWSELAMIVDLVRNDLGKISVIGSVEVIEHAALHTYATLHHLVSEIRARLPPSMTVMDVVKAMFPCGSITGAPKIAAMKVISKLEGTPRGIFSGALGWISPDGDSHFNVAIRTATVKNERFSFHTGGGIVIDSEPDAEYEETLVKAKTLYQLWYSFQN